MMLPRHVADAFRARHESDYVFVPHRSAMNVCEK
jgi:hypothetical protein